MNSLVPKCNPTVCGGFVPPNDELHNQEDTTEQLKRQVKILIPSTASLFHIAITRNEKPLHLTHAES